MFSILKSTRLLQNKLLHIAVFQFNPQKHSLKRNIDLIVFHSSKMKNTLIVLPELFLSSYEDFKFIKQKDLEKVLQKLLDHSRKNKLGFVGSLPISDNKKHYNRAIYINKGKIIGHYDKRNLFGYEHDNFSKGKVKYKVFKFKSIKFSIQICFDITSPIPTYTAAKKEKIELMIIPATVSLNYLQVIAKARSLENQIITVFCNRTGKEKDGIRYNGNSSIFMSNGTEVNCAYR